MRSNLGVLLSDGVFQVMEPLLGSKRRCDSSLVVL
jgi:hypothetical protein